MNMKRVKEAIKKAGSCLVNGECLSRENWQTAASWSAVVFFLSLGLGMLTWSWYLDGGWPGVFGFASRRGGVFDDRSTFGFRDTSIRRALDGMSVPEIEGDADGYYAVMLDNIPAARPQSGIADATLVIEAPVEGGLTRLLAIYPDTISLSRIGPVRSARPYFIDWAEEYGAMLVHVGGSPEALAILRDGDVMDLDEFGGGAYFWRDRKLPAPHNAFTSSEQLFDAAETLYPERESVLLPSWRYKADADPIERPESQNVEIDYDHRNINVTWEYDHERNEYVRWQGGKFADSEGRRVRAKNVIVQMVQSKVLDSVGRKRLTTSGEGDAIVIMDGAAFAAGWEKGEGERITFYDAAGNELSLNSGTTWIQVISGATEVSITD